MPNPRNKPADFTIKAPCERRLFCCRRSGCSSGGLLRGDAGGVGIGGGPGVGAAHGADIGLDRTGQRVDVHAGGDVTGFQPFGEGFDRIGAARFAEYLSEAGAAQTLVAFGHQHRALEQGQAEAAQQGGAGGFRDAAKGGGQFALVVVGQWTQGIAHLRVVEGLPPEIVLARIVLHQDRLGGWGRERLDRALAVGALTVGDGGAAGGDHGRVHFVSGLQIQERRTQLAHLRRRHGGVMGDQWHLPFVDQIFVHGGIKPARLAGRIIGVAAQALTELAFGVGAHDHGDDVMHRPTAAQADEIVINQTPLVVHQQMIESLAPFAEDQQAAMQHVGTG
uniref:Uncharacterized protein n=1 Tax=Magnetospirillum gryphiswaldense TaxID=55518 RepID=A4U4G7_9PROT|nr:hypothetical protein MGR_3842 [Magnetospirillum gryphiswaldense MSR-1]